MPPPTREELSDRFRATLLGVAIGDALAFPYEGVPPGALAPAPADDFAAHPRGRFAKGQFGEGAAGALAVAEAIADVGQVDGTRLGRGLAALYRHAELAVAGGALRQAAERLLAGTPWMAAGAPIGNAGNGAAVRAPAVGLWAAFEPRRLPRDAQVLAVITHKDPRAAAGAAAIAAAVAHGLSGGPLGPALALAAAGAAGSLDPATGAELARVADMAGWEEGPAALSIARLGLQAGERAGGISSFVVPSVGFALWAAIHGQGDFRRTAAAVLRTGGDVDAVCAMAGAIVGAHGGCASLPARLRRGVREAERIVDLADRLLAARVDPKPRPLPARRPPARPPRGPRAGPC